MTFEQLHIYYQEHGKRLNDNFAKNLDLLTADGKYNLNAFLLADQNSTTIKVAKFAGTKKTQLIENEDYGYCSIIKSCKKVLDKLDIENKTLGKAERKAGTGRYSICTLLYSIAQFFFIPTKTAKQTKQKSRPVTERLLPLQDSIKAVL